LLEPPSKKRKFHDFTVSYYSSQKRFKTLKRATEVLTSYKEKVLFIQMDSGQPLIFFFISIGRILPANTGAEVAAASRWRSTGKKKSHSVSRLVRLHPFLVEG
jgi:hypothetical protein